MDAGEPGESLVAVLRQPAVPTAAGGSADASPVRVLLKGAGISGLNPKALLLYFSLFPQFIDAATGWPVAAQTGLLSTVHLTACAVVYLAVGVLARTVLGSPGRHPCQRCHDDRHGRLPAGGTPGRAEEP